MRFEHFTSICYLCSFTALIDVSRKSPVESALSFCQYFKQQIIVKCDPVTICDVSETSGYIKYDWIHTTYWYHKANIAEGNILVLLTGKCYENDRDVTILPISYRLFKLKWPVLVICLENYDKHRRIFGSFTSTPYTVH